jgi:hypothetical protein
MTAVASDALLLQQRLMLELVSSRFGCDLLMAVQAGLSGLPLEELILIRRVGAMTGVTIAFGKRRMCSLCSLLLNQSLMASQTERALICCQLQQSGRIPAVGSMATRAFSSGKRLVLPVKTFL